MRLSTLCLIPAWILLSIGSNVPSVCASSGAAAAQVVFEQHCVFCHKGDDPGGGLNLTRLNSLTQGGKRGPAIEPGKPDESLLLKLVEHQEAPHMPMSMPKLSDEDIAAIREWIAAGAPLPEPPPEIQTAAEPTSKPDAAPQSAPDDAVDFASQVFPIFQTSCLKCHGAKHQQGMLRLDSRASVMKGGLSGPALKPGDADGSLLVKRISDDDAGPRMPMDGDPLPPEQIARIRRWIEDGAKWPDGVGETHAAVARHWAYQRPVLPLPPLVSEAAWVRNPIDRFILKGLDDAGLKHSPEAARETLARRLYLDLTGLPPTLEEVKSFVEDDDPHAYEKLVNRLMASPHFGERWAVHWLDLARYADSHGFEKDREREIWPWRDYVINSFNEDKPFDRFTVEQLAGDLMPGANTEQIVATGFNRNTMINEEGGVVQEEYRVQAVLDRTNTTATVWLGTTLACAQCHNHKYDPFTQKDYYQFYAFFNNHAPEIRQIQSFEAQADGPRVELPTVEQKKIMREIGPRIDELKTLLSTMTPELAESLRRWEGEPGDIKPPGDLKPIVEQKRENRDPKDQARLESWWLSAAPALQPQRDELAELQKRWPAHIASTMVMRELDEPRETHIFQKGSYHSPGEQVFPGTPAVLPPMPPDAPRNRLGLARWLVSERNPLTARVYVNRIWEQIFGVGLVRTTEDFGTRGERPVNQDLLDWLAVRFMQQGWSLKALLYDIVTSSAYRQSSDATPDMIEKDPENRLLARGPRFRLGAEFIRDQALAVSGLLVDRIGGPSVFPYQPPGIWQMPYSDRHWQMSDGGDQYRRGLYTHWQRTAPYPAFIAFDAPSREQTCTRRIRTNTPLQALVTLNDPAFFEAARALARRMADEAGDDPAVRIEHGFELCLIRPPREAELNRLREFYQAMLKQYQGDSSAAAKVLALSDNETASPELAALTMVANVMLNLDETLNKI
ncbi:MAG: DUF1553 domain-containing protein [bacterium]|nr:DUF1553 domain-containing protein [bacterium]